MSREGRRRFCLRLLRWAGGGAALAVAGWGAAEAAAVWRGDPAALSPASAAVPLQHLALATDGVLDQAWLARTLALPSRARLAQLDLAQLRGRVLASGQAREAVLTRDFPATLAVRVAERSPIARIKVQASDGTGERALLVDRYGIVYDGVGYPATLLDSLPWLDGIRLGRREGGFAPIPGMAPVADLLTKAQADAPALYQTWHVLSLARLQSDGVIEVLARDRLKVIFGTQEEFFRQLARLDYLLDAARAQAVGAIAQIDLSLPAQEDSTRPAAVPVTLAADGAAAPPRAPTLLNFLPTKREF